MGYPSAANWLNSMAAQCPPAVEGPVRGRHFAPQIAWLRARLTPVGYAGLQLTLGVVTFIAEAWLFGGIAEDVLHGDPLITVDQHIAMWFRLHRTPTLTTVMQWITRAHEAWTITSACVVLASYLIWKRHWERLWLLVLAVPGGMLLNSILKLAFHRARPSPSAIAEALSSYSFPSGHTMAATVLYGSHDASASDTLRVRLLSMPQARPSYTDHPARLQPQKIADLIEGHIERAAMTDE